MTKVDEAIGMLTRAAADDPHNLTAHCALAWANYFAGRYDAMTIAFARLGGADAKLNNDYARLLLAQASVFGTWVKALTAAGGRAKMDKFYHTNAIENFKKTFRANGGIAKIPLAWRWFPAILEAASFPTMEYLVPRMKMGVFMKMAQHEINALPPGATSLDYRKALTKVWEHVDNRMGQLVYDNLFWSRAFKDAGMLAVRSLGWNLGTAREVGGAITVDIPKAIAASLEGRFPRLHPRLVISPE